MSAAHGQHPATGIASEGEARYQQRKIMETPWITARTELLTMATQTLPITLASAPAADAAFDQTLPVQKPSRLRRVFDFIAAAQMRRAERHIALYCAGRPMLPACADERRSPE
jgi:hypothetical protein